MKKWGFFGVLLVLLPLNVFGAVFDKKITNPYMNAEYTITDVTNNTIYNPYNDNYNDGIMKTINYNSTYSYRISSEIAFMSNSNNTYLDIGDGVLLYHGDDVLNYWLVPICVNHYNFSVSITQGSCPACFEKNDNVSILFDSDNTCQFVNDDFIGPVQYLSDPYSGTRAWLVFHVKQYRVPDTFITATANDRFTIKNIDPNYPLVYRFLNANNNEAGLFDLDGIKEKSLRSNSREVAIIQNNNVNSPYKCENSYNNLNVNEYYFSNDTLTLSTSTLTLIRNFDEKNLFNNQFTQVSQAGTTLSVLYSGIRAYLNVSGSTYRYKGVLLDNTSSLLGKNVTLSADINPSGYNIGRIGFTQVNSSTGTIKQTGIKYLNSSGSTSFTIPSSFDSGFDSFVLLFYSNVNGDGLANDYVDYTNVQLEIGNHKTSFVPYNVYGFNNIISNGNNSVFSFTESNLKSKGKVQLCIKYLDDWNNEYTVDCKDLVSGRESSFLGMESHMYYDGRIEPYNTCLYGFGFLCGQKYPQSVQFQLLDTSNSYYFKKPLLYYYDSNYNKFTGYTEYDTDETSLYKNLPLYVPPNTLNCYDTSTGIMYNYYSKDIIYDSKDSQSLYDNRVYQDNEISNIFGEYELPDNFGLAGLIEIPTNFVNQVRTGTCTPINLSFKIKGQNISALNLPCGDSFWNRNDMSDFRPYISTFITGLFVYKIIFGLYFFIRHNRDPIKITTYNGGEGMMYL